MTSDSPARELADASRVAGATGRMVEELSAALREAGPVFLAGIPTRGVVLAARLARELSRAGVGCSSGSVDISMYRDDLGMRGEIPPVRGTDLPIDIDDWTVVLVDDVQHTGRTARAAIEAVLAFGRPRKILYAVLVDRGGRELPVRPDFTGLSLTAEEGVRIKVRLAETDDGAEGVFAL